MTGKLTGGPQSPAVSVSFQYDAGHQRIRMVDGTTTTIYLNPANGAGLYYEKDVKPAGVEEHRHFVTAGGEVVALVKTNQLGAVASTSYLHHDALGSLVTVTNSLKLISESLSYEPFGKRRQINGAADPGNNLSGSTSNRGYTMHEHLDDLDLINMNARLYDPVIGRFLSADSVIQDSANTQSYNRYSYVGNNPLTYTDPTGHWNLFKHLGRFFEGLAISTFNPLGGLSMEWRALPGTSRVDHFVTSHPWAYSAAQIVSGVVSVDCLGCGAAVFSAYYTYESTGSLTAGYEAGGISMGTNLAFYGVGSIPSTGSLWDDAAINLAGHTAVGCASAAAGGGKCGSGAAAAFIGDAVTIGTKGLGVPLQFAVVVASGGAASMISGEKFFSEVGTAAAGYIYNFCRHDGCFNRRFDLLDAIYQWRNGDGGTVTDVKASELNLTDATYVKNPDGTYMIHTSLKFDTGAIYGTVTGVLNSDGTMSIKPDIYNFDFKNPLQADNLSESWRLVKRDIFTGAGAIVNGYGGKPYRIEFIDTISAPVGLPQR